MRSYFLISILWLLFANNLDLRAQVLDKYIQEGLVSNTTLDLERLQQQKSKHQVREARGKLLPAFLINSSYTVSEGGRSFDLPVGDLFNPIHRNLNLLNQRGGVPIETTYPADLENASTTFLPNNFHESRLIVRAPIFDRSLYLQYRATQAQATIGDTEQQISEQDLVLDIKVTYYRYLQSLSLTDSYNETIELLKEILDTNKKLVRNHKATRNVIDDAKYRIKKTERQRALVKRDQQNARAYLNYLINRPLDTPIAIDSTVLMSSDQTASVDSLERQAVAHRKELGQLDQALEVQDYQLAAVRGRYLPSLMINGEIGYQGEAYHFGTDQQYWLAQASLSWPLFTGFRRQALVQQQQIEQKILSKRQEELRNQIRLEVQDAYYELEAAELALASAEAEVKSTASTFDIIRQRYRQRKASVIEYQTAETNYANAKTTLVISKYDVLISQAKLERATAY